MNEQQLSKRLAKVAAHVPLKSVLADIGSDHAYLPCYLALKGSINKAIAGEVVAGPYESACFHVRSLQLENQVMVRLGSGLEIIDPQQDQVTVYTICGMGGSLITSILEQGWLTGKLTKQERLILQPNVGEYLVRNWLTDHHYKISTEEILEEDDKIYEIIVAEYMGIEQEYTSEEYTFGPLLLKEKSAAFMKKWERELKSKEKVLQSLKNAKHKPIKKETAIKQQIAEIRKVLEECN